MRSTLIGAVALVVGAAACAANPATSATAGIDRSTSTVTTARPPQSTTTAVATTLPPAIALATPLDPAPWPDPPVVGRPPVPGATGIAVIGVGGAGLSVEPESPAFVLAHEGLVLPVESRRADWLEVRTPCDTTAWVDGRSVAFLPTPVDTPDELSSAVVVIDPGHGGPNRGATGPSGLIEATINVDVARRTADLLRTSHTVDWATGTLLVGDEVGPVGTVWLTRAAGPLDADYEAGLLFRTRLAGMAGADALISIHNNADPDGPYDGPGSEVFYSVTNLESRRLAGILMEEFRLGFARFDADWVGDTDAGAKYRVRSDGVTDYYGILRNSGVPAVIAEGAFISNPSEEALLATVEFRQAYAEAVYRAVIRFLTTTDPGSFFTEPYERFVEAGRGDPLPTCEVPAQP